MNKKSLIAILFISISCIAVYSNSLSNPFIWDDNLLIKQNPFIRNWKFLPDIFTTDIFHMANSPSNFYRPLQTLTLFFDYHLWQLNPFGYHLTNIILHLITSILIYFLILKISQQPLTSLLAGLLLTVHPVHTEAVTYIAGRADSLVAIFLLASLLTYLNPHTQKASLERGVGVYSILFFILALLSKELALIFPFILILYELSFKKNIQNINFRKLIPFFAITLAYLCFRFGILRFIEANLSFQFNRGYFLKLATSVKILFSYLGLLLFPQELQMGRGYPLAKSFFEPALLLFYLLLILSLGLAIRSYNKSRFAFFFSFWFFIFLLPGANLIELNALLAEHWLYLPSIGFFALLAKIIERLINRQKIFMLIFISFFIYFSFITVSRNFEWRDEVNFYKKILKNNPEAITIWYNLGTTYLNQEKIDEAEKAFKNMLALQPNQAEALVNLGIVYYQKGKLKEGEACALKAIKIAPECKEAYCLLGDIYAEAGMFRQAEEKYRQAIELAPLYFTNYLNLGVLYAEQGKLKKAIAFWKMALELNPESFEAHYNLEKARKSLGR